MTLLTCRLRARRSSGEDRLPGLALYFRIPPPLNSQPKNKCHYLCKQTARIQIKHLTIATSNILDFYPGQEIL